MGIDRSTLKCRYIYRCLLIREKKKLSCTLCKATGRTVTNHLGSAAFGAFLITLVRIPRYILMKINQKYVTVSAYHLINIRISALFYMLISRQDVDNCPYDAESSNFGFGFDRFTAV